MNSFCGCSDGRSPKFSSAVRPQIVEGGSGNVSSSEVSIIRVLDRADYDALEFKDPKTLYLIRG